MLIAGVAYEFPRLIESIRHRIEITRIHAPPDTRRIDFNSQARSTVHGRCQWLSAAHTSETTGQENPALERAAEMFPAGRSEGFIRSLYDALRADIDPTACRHLPVHRELKRLE